MRRRVLWLLLAVLAGMIVLHDGTKPVPDGVLAAAVPQQTAVQDGAFEFHGYRIERLAGFALEARVLGKERYWLDRESKLAKYDLALGWGRMSDSRVLASIDISQSGRWYHWRTDHFPIPRREIERSSANMHLIAATDAIEHRIGNVEEGNLVRLKGYLVRVTAPDGWHWQSSLTRNDTGNGACELVFVESFERL